MIRPIRTETTHTTVTAPWDRIVHPQEDSQTTHVLNGQEIISKTDTNKTVLYCGCIGDSSGCCSICNNAVCTACFSRCSNTECLRPLGPCHGRKFQNRSGESETYCPECLLNRKRKRWFRLILSPFIRWKDES